MGRTLEELLNLGLQHRHLLKELAAKHTSVEVQVALGHNTSHMERAYAKLETLTGLQDPLHTNNDPSLLITQIHEFSKQHLDQSEMKAPPPPEPPKTTTFEPSQN